VQLNFPLREPLVLEGELPRDTTARATRPFVAGLAAPPAPASLPELPPRTVVVAGRHERDRDLGAVVAEFCERAGFPLLADPLSGARHGPAAIAHYDVLLRPGPFATGVQPDAILRIGDLPTSKPQRTWLAGLAGIEQIALDPEAAWQDPAAVLSAVVGGDPATTLRAAMPDTAADPDWLARWRAADDAAAVAIAAALGEDLSEPSVARALMERLPREATVFVAASMPIRDVELFAGARELAPRVLSNRGANGIDGTVSSAFGAAAAGDGPVVALIGDVALAHDVGGLLAARRLGLDLTLVLLNNDGGGIFHFLPVAREGEAFVEHVATPHGLDFAHAAALYGCAYERISDLASLRAALERSLSAGGTAILEVPSGREANLELHRTAAGAVARALEALGSR
jgi:2-succinyl-5-enolpyruvyl-6-hydroxy-3-cyclohexene-1-carboxylate synthase